MSLAPRTDSPLAVRQLDLSYDHHDSEATASKLIHTLFPEWRHSEGEVRFVRFTDGITNTLLKAEKRRPGRLQEEIDKDAVLLRAYGEGTDVLIDREREVRAHSILANRGLAPPLLARFNNGLLYRFISGKVCTQKEIQTPEIYRAVAEKLGQWHGALSIGAISDSTELDQNSQQARVNGIDAKLPDIPFPNVWSILQSWIHALPAESDKQRERIRTIQVEFDFLKQKLSDTPGLYGKDYIFSHCDLLLGNVIVEKTPVTNGAVNGDDQAASLNVNFIDYEYATPAPAAFDIANHFAEWVGMECDYSMLPTKSQRRDFIEHYVRSYQVHSYPQDSESHTIAAIDQLYDQVDLFRGMPGFWWGVWSLIQAQISQIDFDYANYAELRFGEYHAWKAEVDGSREREGKDKEIREKRWAIP